MGEMTEQEAKVREVGISQPWPVVTIELTTFQLKIIDDALEFASEEVEKLDKNSIEDIRSDIKKVLGRVRSAHDRSSGFPDFRILRRRR